MTREELQELLVRSPLSDVSDAVLKHDAEQRQLVEQQAQEIERLNSCLSHWTFVRYRQMEETVTVMREVLKGMVSMSQESLRDALDSGDHLKIITEVTRLFNACRDRAQCVLEETKLC